MAGCTRAPRRRASVGTRSGIDAKSSRYAGQAGMSSRQNVLASMLARSEKPFTRMNAASQPPSSAAIASAPHAEHGEEPGERGPLREPRAPEELAQLRPSARASARSRGGSSGRGSGPTGEDPSPRAKRACSSANAGTSPSPRSFQSARTRSAGAIAAPHASPSRQRRATTYASTAPTTTSRFGGFSAAAAPRGGRRARRPGRGRARGSARRRAPPRARAPSTGSRPSR